MIRAGPAPIRLRAGSATIQAEPATVQAGPATVQAGPGYSLRYRLDRATIRTGPATNDDTYTDSGTREPGGGGSGGNFPPQLWSCWGAPPPPLWTVSVMFIFVCFCTWISVSSKKIVGQIWELLVLGRGYLGSPEIAPPPPPTSK